MTTPINSAMREAFAAAVAEKKPDRTATFAKVKSALHRKCGVTNRKSMWSVERERK